MERTSTAATHDKLGRLLRPAVTLCDTRALPRSEYRRLRRTHGRKVAEKAKRAAATAAIGTGRTARLVAHAGAALPPWQGARIVGATDRPGNTPFALWLRAELRAIRTPVEG